MIGHLVRRVTRRRVPWWVLLLVPLIGIPGLLIILIVVILLVVTAATTTASPGTTSPSCGGSSVTVTGTAPGLTPDQQSNAQAIAGVALGLGLGRPGVLVGVLTADVEADLHNLTIGDIMANGQMSSSRGLFQQLIAWIPLGANPDPRLDPVKAATMFYTGGAAGQRGLTQIPGWQQMDPGVAMQAVQGSQFAGRTSPGYAAKLAQATAVTNALMAGQPSATVPAASATPVVAAACGPAGPAPTGLTQNPSQNPATFGWVRASGIVPYSWQGHVVAGGVANGTQPLWDAFLTALAPHIPGGITSLGGFENRNNVNNPSAVSFHAYGLAIDINASQNPNGAAGYGRTGVGVIPGQVVHDLAARYCMESGVDFTGTPDPMHAEIHCSPTQLTKGTS